MERTLPGTIIFQLTGVTQMLSHYWVKEENGNLIHIAHVMGEETRCGIVHKTVECECQKPWIYTAI